MIKKSIIFGFLFLICINIVTCAVANIEENKELKNKWIFEEQFFKADKNRNNIPVILIHGFMASPYDYKPLAPKLVEKGYDVIIPIVPGQISKISVWDRGDYDAKYYTSWLDSIISKTTKEYKTKPFLVGHSMGGTISSCIANKDKVEKLVLIAPFYSLPRLNGLITGSSYVLKYLIPIIPKLKKGMINDSKGYKLYEPGSKLISVSAFLELEKLAKISVEKAFKLNLPTLILCSSNDKVSSFKKIKEVADYNENVDLVVYTKSNHIVLYDYDSDDAVKQIIKFFKIQ